MEPKQPRVLFFARVADRKLIDLLEFYREDVELLSTLGYEVCIETSLHRAIWTRCDVLYAWWWDTSFPVVAAYRLRRRPIVATGAFAVRDPARRAGLQRIKLLAKSSLTGATARLASVNVAISKHEVALLRQLRAPRVHLVHLSVDVGYFAPGVPATPPTIAIVAQLNPFSIRRKGVDVTIRAFQQLRKYRPDAVLRLIGPITDEGRRHLDELGGESGLLGVRIEGELTRDRKRDVLASSWLYCQPSMSEGFGLAVAEAMASGAVPVVSDIPALREVVGGTGDLVPERTPDAVARHLIALIGDSERRRELSTAARDRAVAHFSRPVRAERLRTILESVDGRVSVAYP